MKKRIFLAILPIIGLLSCSNVTDTPRAPITNDYELNQVLLKELNEGEVILNLTPNGLYNGEKGSKSTDYHLENYVLLNLNVGDALPTTDSITSTVEDVEFVSWQFATSDGELAYVDTVQEGQKYYQAYFNYVGVGEEDEYIPGDDLSSEAAPDDRTIYVKNNAGWSTVNAYYWNDYRNNGWPGSALKIYDEANSIYSLDISPIYVNIIFNNGSGEQTADLRLYEDVNIYTVGAGGTVSYGWYENGTITPVEVKPVEVSDYYFRGSNNGWGVTMPLTKVDDNTYTITLDLTSGVEFKIASSDWSWEANTIQGEDAANFSGGHGEYSSNLRCDVAGNYTFTLTVSTKVIDVVKN